MKNTIVLFAVLFSFFICLPAFAQDVAVETPQVESNVEKSAGSNDAEDVSSRLASDIESAFAAIPDDPDPNALVNNTHYWISNENAHYVWYPHIQAMGGVLSGVGTDQLYLIAGWSKPSVIVPLDFDRKVRDLHYVYGTAFIACKTPEEFIAFWEQSSTKKVRKFAREYFPERAADIESTWKQARTKVFSRNKSVVAAYKKLKLPIYLNDAEQYGRLRELWMNHRVFPICGNLVGDQAVFGLGEALKKTNMKMGIFYLSNAERYFTYTPSFHRNIENIPFADNGIILRTRQIAALGVPKRKDYHYSIQAGENFQNWLKNSSVDNQLELLEHRENTETTGLSRITKQP